MVPSLIQPIFSKRFMIFSTHIHAATSESLWVTQLRSCPLRSLSSHLPSSSSAPYTQAHPLDLADIQGPSASKSQNPSAASCPNFSLTFIIPLHLLPNRIETFCPMIPRYSSSMSFTLFTFHFILLKLDGLIINYFIPNTVHSCLLLSLHPNHLAKFQLWVNVNIHLLVCH